MKKLENSSIFIQLFCNFNFFSDPKGNNQVKDAFDPNPNNTNMPLNVTQDAQEAASDRSDDSTQLRAGEDGDAEESSLLSDSF